jgi:hypothetical protein
MTNPQLPDHVLSKAYVSPGAGEFAWKRADLPEALHALVEAGHAILGGETWIVEARDRNWNGLIPSKDGSPPAVWSWDTSAQRPNESWRVYCERTLRESLEAIEHINVEDEAAETVVPMLWFNVTSVGSDDV